MTDYTPSREVREKESEMLDRDATWERLLKEAEQRNEALRRERDELLAALERVTKERAAWKELAEKNLDAQQLMQERDEALKDLEAERADNAAWVETYEETHADVLRLAARVKELETALHDLVTVTEQVDAFPLAVAHGMGLDEHGRLVLEAARVALAPEEDK